MARLSLLIVAALAAIDQSCAFSLSQNVGGRTTASSTRLSMTVESNDQKKDINVGVIGCGRIGIVHLGAISKAPGVKAVIVSNPTVSKAEAGEKMKEQLLLRFTIQRSLFP